MITFLLGLPGSGKTYYAVDRIFNNFSNDEEAKKDKKISFKNCYTNINEFKYEKVNNVHKLDFDKLHEILTRLHSFTKGKNKKNDKQLIKFCRRVKIKDTLFVIDEAHNFFDKKDIVLVWWLSYHRHLYHEIILITQNLGLIESKYKAFSEFFYVAKPNSLRLFKSHFKYNIFTQSRLSKASAVGDIKFKLNDKIFALYQSGDSVDSKNLVLKYILIAIVIFSLIFGFFYFFISSKIPNDSKNIVTVEEQMQNTSASENINKDIDEKFFNYDEESKFFSLACSSTICSNNDISIPSKLLGIFIKSEDIKVLYRDKINTNLTNIYLDCSKEFYNYISTQKKDEHEENNDNISIFGNNNDTSK